VRITIISPIPSLSGGFKVIVIYAQRLARMGHTVHFVFPPGRTTALRHKMKSWLRGNGWPNDSLLPQSHLDGSNIDYNVLDRLRPVTDDDVPDADVVIATWWQTAEWVANLAPQKGAKVHFIQHYEIFDGPRHDYFYGSHDKIVDSPLVARVKAVWRLPLYKITISKWLVDLAAREYGIKKTWLIHNSVDTDQFYAPPRGRQGRPTVGLLYSAAKWKGVDVSLSAIELASKRIPGLRVISFGAEPIVDYLPLPTGAIFHYRPEQNSIRNLYASCDVWLCGSYSEGFHLPPLEAMACRCPVVSTSVGGPMDIVESGYNGYLVPTGDAQALADRLVDVLNLDDTAWRAMSDAALATATRYTWDDAAKLMERALGEIITLSQNYSHHSVAR